VDEWWNLVVDLCLDANVGWFFLVALLELSFGLEHCGLNNRRLFSPEHGDMKRECKGTRCAGKQ
jgi:hypothetical protein